MATMDNMASLDDMDAHHRLVENQHVLQGNEEYIRQKSDLEMDFPSKETMSRRRYVDSFV